jgi:hypothetical protein
VHRANPLFETSRAALRLRTRGTLTAASVAGTAFVSRRSARVGRTCDAGRRERSTFSGYAPEHERSATRRRIETQGHFSPPAVMPEDSRLELLCGCGFSGVAAPRREGTVAGDAMRCDGQLRPRVGGPALARGVRIGTRPRPPGSQFIGRLIAPSGMLLSDESATRRSVHRFAKGRRS